MAYPEISVVVPTYNRLARLKSVLNGLVRQDLPRDDFEVIVVSDGATDGTNEYLATMASTGNIRPLLQANSGPAAARNRGIAAATGRFVVFIDDDVVPAERCLAEHLRSHRSAETDVAVIGPLLSPQDFKLSPWVNWEQEMLVKQYAAMREALWKPTARQFFTGNASVRRELLLAAGGFDESFRRAEDVELAFRLADRGLEFVFTMSAVGWHYAERSFESWLATAYAYGRNDAIFARDRKQEWLIPVVKEEFGQRRRPLKQLILACQGRPRLASASMTAIRSLARAAGVLGTSAIERAAYSAMFGLQYYQGFCSEIAQPNFLSRGVSPQTAQD